MNVNKSLLSSSTEGWCYDQQRSVRFADGYDPLADDSRSALHRGEIPASPTNRGTSAMWDLLSDELDQAQQALNRAMHHEKSLRTAALGVKTLPSFQPPTPPGALQKFAPRPTADAPEMMLPGQIEGNGIPKLEHADSLHVPNKQYELLPMWRSERGRVGLSVVSHKTSQRTAVDASPAYEIGDEGRQRLSVASTRQCVGRTILHPNSRKKSTWELCSIFLVSYDMIMIPFGFFDPEKTTFLLVAEWVTRLFWSLDIVISLNSGYVTKYGTVEMRPGRIWKRYLRTWFALDCLVVFVDWVEIILWAPELGFARMGKASRVLRILRMLRLLRLAKISQIANVLAERLPSERLVILVDIVKLVTIMLGVAHLIGCMWYALGAGGPETRNWLAEFGYEGELLEYRYIMSLRWALSQFAGGMDEVTPMSLQEHIYAAAMYISCFWCGTVFLSILTSNMTQLYLLGNQKSQQINVIRRYLSQNGVTKSLALRVLRNAQHALEMQARATPESAVGLTELVSEPLRIELHFEMYSPLLGCHPFFAMYMKLCPTVVRKVCHFAMAISATTVGDYIFHYGQSSNQMLLVKSGLVNYNWGGYNSKELGLGSWLSEAALWVRWVHRGSLKSVGDSITFTLSAKDFHRIVSQFELTKFDPAEYAEVFLDNLNNAASDEVTDLPLQVLQRQGERRKALLADHKQHHRAWMHSLFGRTASFGGDDDDYKGDDDDCRSSCRQSQQTLHSLRSSTSESVMLAASSTERSRRADNDGSSMPSMVTVVDSTQVMAVRSTLHATGCPDSHAPRPPEATS